MLKFLHCADVHLDTPFSLLDIEKSDLRRAELRTTFTSMMLYIRKSGIRLVLIAGDLFSQAFVTRDTLRQLAKEFASVPDCQFVIAPGCHDPYTPASPYAKTRFPENVHIFTSSEVSCISLDALGADIYGAACTARSMHGAEPLSAFHVRDSSRINLFVCHADLSGNDPDALHVTKEQLAHAGFDYAALGHDHNSDGIRRIGQTYFGYAGCLEGRSFAEPGYKGAVCGELSKNTEANPPKVQFAVRRLRFSRKHYETAEADLSGCDSIESASARIRAVIAARKFDADTALQLTLSGTIPPDLLFSEEALQKNLPAMFLFRIIDHTTSEQTYAQLKEDPTLRGAFYRELSDAFDKDKETAALALRLGLQALSSES